MMNKTRSAKRQLIRLLFLLPATAVLLLAFRSKWSAAGNAAVNSDKKVTVAALVVDAKTVQPLAGANILNSNSPADAETVYRDTTKKSKPNSKGYIISIKNINGEDMVIIKNAAGKAIKSITVKEWDENEEKYEKIYGESITVSPAPPIPPLPPATPVIAETISPVTATAVVEVPVTASVNVVAKTSSPVKAVTVVSAPVKVVTGSTVSVVTEVPVNGVVEVPVTTTVIATPGTPATPAVVAKLPDNVKKVQIDNNKVTLWLKNGKKENFDLNNAEEKKELEKKYGIYAPAKPVPPVEVVQPVKGN